MLTASTAVVAFTLLTAPPSAPSDVHDGDPDRARRVAAAAFAEGVSAFDREDYAMAIAAFEAADAWVSHPHTRFNLGLALAAEGRRADAWRVLETVERDTQDAEEREDVRRELASLERELGIVDVHTDPGAIVCLDGHRVPVDAPGHTMVPTTPGAHQIGVAGYPVEIELRAGEVRVMNLERIGLLGTDERPSPIEPMTGTAAGFALAGAGLAIGALAAKDDGVRTGLGASAAASAAIAGGIGLAALLLQNRSQRPSTPGARRPDPAVPVDPGCPTPGQN